MGAVSAGIKLFIANIVISIVMFVVQIGLIAAAQSESVQQHIDTVASDPAAATTLPATFLIGIILLVVFLIVLQGAIVHRLWGWD